MAQRQKGHIYGLKTNKGVASLQLAEEPETPTSLQLTRVCDGFLEGEYTDEDILRIVRRPERFFLETPLRAIGPRSRVYREFFAFDRPFALPDGLELPKYQRGFVVRSDGSVQWYKKRRGGRDRRFVTVLTKVFLQLSPDSCWSLPDLREFLESGKAISDYV